MNVKRVVALVSLSGACFIVNTPRSSATQPTPPTDVCACSTADGFTEPFCQVPAGCGMSAIILGDEKTSTCCMNCDIPPNDPDPGIYVPHKIYVTWQWRGCLAADCDPAPTLRDAGSQIKVTAVEDSNLLCDNVIIAKSPRYRLAGIQP